ncbi:MAG: DMT family transporter [Rhizobiaceae bacterium]
MSTSILQVRNTRMDGNASLLMVFLTLVWGMNAVAGKVAVEGFDPIFLSFLRAALAIVAVYGWCRYRKIRIFERDGSLLSGCLVGILFGIEFLLIYWGLDLTSASRANLMTNTMPLFTLIGGHYILKERVSWLKFIAMIIAFVGVFFVFFDKLSMPAPNAVLGDLLCIMGGAAWAATALAIRATRVGTVAPEKTLLYQLAGAVLVALPFLPYSDGLLRNPGLAEWAALAFQAFFVVAFTYVIWFWLMAKYPLGGLSAFTFLSPVFGVLLSALFLGDPLTMNVIYGTGLIVFGLVLINTSFGKAK